MYVYLKLLQGFIQDFELVGRGGKQDSSRMIVACVSMRSY